MDENAISSKSMGIPYGMMNFVAIREDNYYYVDKTRFIEKIENSNRYFFFIRPRRFGKSLTMSMLRHYYDINTADKFERLYDDLYIGKNPTPNRNKYLVMNLNFAVVNADLGNYRSAMDAHCRIEFTMFCRRYANLLSSSCLDEMIKEDGAVKQLDYLCKACLNAGQKIYLFIDEYDHFTNNILSDATREKEYRKETHGTGYLRTFFDTIKSGTDSSIERVFITGVSPVTLDDLTYDGYDIRKKEQLMAYCGDFKPFFQFIADSIYTFASQRDRQKGKSFVHGYTLALTSLCRFYRPITIRSGRF